MASERKILANRSNSRASTGPRTTVGKARSARNARRHGLAVSVLGDVASVAELDSFVNLLVGQEAPRQLRELAILIAAAQMDLVRVRQARGRLLSRDVGGSDSLELSTEGVLPAKHDEMNRATDVFDVAQQLVAIDRYERRALSRRKAAIRAFNACRYTVDSDGSV